MAVPDPGVPPLFCMSLQQLKLFPQVFLLCVVLDVDHDPEGQNPIIAGGQVLEVLQRNDGVCCNILLSIIKNGFLKLFRT